MKNKIVAPVIAITAAIGLAVFGGDNDRHDISVVGKSEKEIRRIVSQEKHNAAIGSEITTLRDTNSLTVKKARGLYEARVYTKPVSYFDAETGLHKPIDLSVKTNKNPLAKYNRYIDAGPWKAEYDDKKPHDYKFTVRGKSVEISALFDSVEVQTVYDTDGVKQTVILNESDPHTLEWNVDYHSSINATAGDEIRFSDNDGFLFLMKRFIGWDSTGEPVKILSTYRDHIIRVTVTGEYTYPIYIDPSVAIASSNLRRDYVQGGWAASRVEINAANISQNNLVIIGADSISTSGTITWRINRPFLSFPIPSGVTDVISADLLFDGLATSTSNSFEVYIIGADTSKTFAEPFTQFDGYVYNDAYTGTALNQTWTNPGDYDADSTRFSFNAAGIDSIEFESGDTLHVVMLADVDYSNSEPANGDWFTQFNTAVSGGFDPYLSITYIGESVVVTATADSTSGGQVNAFDASDYEAARDATTGDGNSQTSFIIGQSNSGTNQVWRTFVTVDLSNIPSEAVVNGVKLYWNGVTDGSSTDFTMWPVQSHHSGAVSNGWFNDFLGWAASGAYSPTYYAENGWSSGGYTTSADSLLLNAAFRDSVQAAIGDTIRFALLSAEDVASDSAQASEYVRLGGFRLGLFIDAMRPQNFTMTPISGTTDSVLCSWDDYALDETGYRLIEDVAKTLVSGTDTTAANVTSIRVGGLSINSSYAWRVQTVGGALADSMSAADSTYTYAAIPGSPTTSQVSNSQLKFIVDVNSNPSYTEFAVQDSISGYYVDYTAVPDTLKATAVWGTYTQWGGASGDTLTVYPGQKYAIRVKARSGQ